MIIFLKVIPITSAGTNTINAINFLLICCLICYQLNICKVFFISSTLLNNVRMDVGPTSPIGRDSFRLDPGTVSSGPGPITRAGLSIWHSGLVHHPGAPHDTSCKNIFRKFLCYSLIVKLIAAAATPLLSSIATFCRHYATPPHPSVVNC